MSKITSSDGVIDWNLLDFRLWSKEKNHGNKMNLNRNITHKVSSIKNESSQLKEEVMFNNLKNKSKKENPKIKKAFSLDRFSEMSQKTKEILKKTLPKIEKIKKSTDFIAERNELYLEQNLNNKGNLKQKIRNFKNIKEPFHSKKEKPHHKGKTVRNFNYINNNYRKQLHRAFMGFNPKTHLENMKLLQQSDPSINQDILLLRQTIKSDLDEILQPNFFKKRYEYMVKKRKKIDEKNINSHPQINTSINELTLNMQNLSINHQNHLPKNFFKNLSGKVHNYIKTVLPKRNIALEIEYFKKAYHSLGDMISTDNVTSNIKRSIKDYYYKNNRILGDGEKKKAKNFFELQKNKTENILKTIYQLKLKRNNNVQQKIPLELKEINNSFKAKLSHIKDNLKNDIETSIEKIDKFEEE